MLYCNLNLEVLLLGQLIPIPLITKTQTGTYSRKPRKKNRISYLFRSTLPENIELIESIDQLVHSINGQNSICIELIHCGFENQNCLNQQDRLAIYLIVRAQIRNILRNTEASSATVHLAKNYGKVAIVIEDNGMATDVARMKNGRAVRTIQNLVKHHKGRCNFNFEQDKGTVIEALIEVADSSE